MRPLKITGLWPTKSGTGWSGKCGNTRVLILPVDKTKTDNPRAPDYELLLAPIDENLPLTSIPMPEAEAARAQGYAATKPSHQRASAEPPADHPAFDENIPF
jgi:hypothetical protein